MNDDAAARIPSSTGRQRFNEITNAMYLFHATCTAASLGLADAIGDAPTRVDDIAARLGLHGPSLYRMLRALAANGIFEELGDSRFQHTELSRRLRSDHPFSLRALAEFFRSPVQQDAWGGLVDAIRDGKAGFTHRRGKTIYEHLRADAADSALFNRAMLDHSLEGSAMAAQAYTRFGEVSSVLDVGGGLGTLASAIVKAHPHVRATVLDLPHLEPSATRYLQEAGVGDRVSFHPGDFFEAVPGGHDLYIVKHCLWNWGDDECSRILRVIRRAIGDANGARLLIMEQILQPSNLARAALADVLMLTISAGGRCRSDGEYRELTREAGFHLDSVLQLEDIAIAELLPV
ncbi:methyltransferase [Sorangium sp. So ce590]|uniref:methyltransferase n=1 Tax=unclassified Sorangium TaxID=2621164 RepID=UPI003F63DFD7